MSTMLRKLNQTVLALTMLMALTLPAAAQRNHHHHRRHRNEVAAESTLKRNFSASAKAALMNALKLPRNTSIRVYNQKSVGVAPSDGHGTVELRSGLARVGAGKQGKYVVVTQVVHTDRFGFGKVHNRSHAVGRSALAFSSIKEAKMAQEALATLAKPETIGRATVNAAREVMAKHELAGTPRTQVKDLQLNYHDIAVDGAGATVGYTAKAYINHAWTEVSGRVHLDGRMTGHDRAHAHAPAQTTTPFGTMTGL
jgi:hypothetical protein